MQELAGDDAGDDGSDNKDVATMADPYGCILPFFWFEWSNETFREHEEITMNGGGLIMAFPIITFKKRRGELIPSKKSGFLPKENFLNIQRLLLLIS